MKKQKLYTSDESIFGLWPVPCICAAWEIISNAFTYEGGNGWKSLLI